MLFLLGRGTEKQEDIMDWTHCQDRGNIICMQNVGDETSEVLQLRK
jgi:hypothetical protein